MVAFYKLYNFVAIPDIFIKIMKSRDSSLCMLYIVSFSEAQAHRKWYEKWVTAAPVPKQMWATKKHKLLVKNILHTSSRCSGRNTETPFINLEKFYMDDI